jgi:hypothetical protein
VVWFSVVVTPETSKMAMYKFVALPELSAKVTASEPLAPRVPSQVVTLKVQASQTAVSAIVKVDPKLSERLTEVGSLAFSKTATTITSPKVTEDKKSAVTEQEKPREHDDVEFEFCCTRLESATANRLPIWGR